MIDDAMDVPFCVLPRPNILPILCPKPLELAELALLSARALPSLSTSLDSCRRSELGMTRSPLASTIEF